MMADEENNKDVELQRWLNGFWREDEFGPNKIFTSLASKHRNRLPCVLGRQFFGSFHICVRVVFDDGVSWIIRVPLPFRLLQRDAHTEREVAILQCLRERTAIPVPEIIAYGFGGTSHPALGPFIITTFIHAIPLTDWWKDPKSKETRPRSDIGEEVVKKVYRQAANIILELASLRFSAIGTLATTDDENLTWSIKYLPWSITLHEAERNHGIQPQAADGPFDIVKDWLSYIFNHHEKIILEIPGPTQSQDLLNLRRFQDLAPRYISDSRSRSDFRLHCDDFGAGNMLVDGDYNVVCLGDWEFTYAAPTEYQCSLTSWLILSKPHTWSQEDYNCYSTQLDLFLPILEEEEKRLGTDLIEKPESCLSNVIKQGKIDGTFWFVQCARSGLFFDELWERFEKFDPINFPRKSKHRLDHSQRLVT